MTLCTGTNDLKPSCARHFFIVNRRRRQAEVCAATCRTTLGAGAFWPPITHQSTKQPFLCCLGERRDLRRSFGGRWAARATPQVIKELMRHALIETTMKYYVVRNTQSSATVLWDALGRIGDSNAPAAVDDNGGNANNELSSTAEKRGKSPTG